MMGTPKLLLSKLLRRRRPPTITSSFSSSYYYSLSESSHSIFLRQSSYLTTPSRRLPPSAAHSQILPYSLLSFRSLSTHDSEDVRDLSQTDELGFPAGLEVTEALVSAASAAATDGSGESILPIRALISMLDCYHDFTGFPWWVVIASSTLALRITLLPVLILQLKKLQKIADSFPKLPRPLPPPLSGRSYINQLLFFRKERRAIGCPSYLWFLAYVSVQVPCFFLWMTTVRRMSLDHHPGFDCGGTLWFQNLSEFPHGVLGPIFPLLIASLHFVNVQVSFRTSSIGKVSGLFGLLAQYYKFYLDLLTLPILFTGFCIPQGSLVYWLTNSSLTLVQQLSLNHPGVRAKLGLPDKVDPVPPANPGEMDSAQADLVRNQRKIPLQNLSPQELLAFYRLALDKDPEYVRALVVMGQTLLQDKQLAEATEYLERAISKLLLIGHPTEVEEIDLLILASQWAGVACIRQGRNADGIRHLERVANMEEPRDTKSKAHYYDAFVLLASALYNEGRKTEATKYMRMAAAYDSSYNEYLEQCEKDDDSFVTDLASSRRGDY